MNCMQDTMVKPLVTWTLFHALGSRGIITVGSYGNTLRRVLVNLFQLMYIPRSWLPNVGAMRGCC